MSKSFCVQKLVCAKAFCVQRLLCVRAFSDSKSFLTYKRTELIKKSCDEMRKVKQCSDEIKMVENNLDYI